jgi:hypothetical protein
VLSLLLLRDFFYLSATDQFLELLDERIICVKCGRIRENDNWSIKVVEDRFELALLLHKYG